GAGLLERDAEPASTVPPVVARPRAAVSPLTAYADASFAHARLLARAGRVDSAPAGLAGRRQLRPARGPAAQEPGGSDSGELAARIAGRRIQALHTLDFEVYAGVGRNGQTAPRGKRVEPGRSRGQGVGHRGLRRDAGDGSKARLGCSSSPIRAGA